MKIFVLGSNGMLGHMVKRYLEQYHEIETINYRWPSDEFKTAITDSNADFLINCVGAIPQRTKDFTINWELPIWLDTHFNSKIIHPSTDCEVDKDVYGLSKAKATAWILSKGQKTKIIKTSIIGPELKGNASLMGWFLSQKGEVYGYTKAIWNGITTLEWAKQCLSLINNWENYPNLTIPYSDSISKFGLLNIIKEVYNKDDVEILPKDLGKNKVLNGTIKTSNIKSQILELKNI